MTILNAKQRRLSDAARVQTLVRIGKRAIARADWLDELLRTYYVRNGTDLERAQTRRTIQRARERASLAAAEIVEIVEHTDDLHLRRKLHLYRTTGGNA